MTPLEKLSDHEIRGERQDFGNQGLLQGLLYDAPSLGLIIDDHLEYALRPFKKRETGVVRLQLLHERDIGFARLQAARAHEVDDLDSVNDPPDSCP